MIEFILFIATLAGAILVGIPLGILGWKVACALGGWKSTETWGRTENREP